jgi:transposase
MIDQIRRDLESVAAYQHNLPRVRAEAVDAARKAGMTWREIASILNMTEHGLIKADKKWRETNSKV